MNKVVFDGKTYVKASVLARELGYTTDYVGQLCRAEKVECQLVGRSWYVEEDSLRTHKSNRYRSVKTKSKKSIRDQVAENANTTSHFYRHTPRVTTAVAAYHADDAELLPTPAKEQAQKKRNVPVELADAKEVKIISDSPTYNFEAPVREDIKFYGTLRVSNVPDESPVVEEKKSKQHGEKIVVTAENDEVSLSVPISKTPSSKIARKKTLLKNRDGVIAMSRGENLPKKQAVKGREDASGVAVHPDDVEQDTYRGGGLIIALSTTTALVALVTIVGLETQIQSTAQATIISYSFTIKNISALLYLAI